MKKFIVIALYSLTFSLSLAATCGVNSQGNKYCSYDNGCYEYWNRNGTHYSSCNTNQNLPVTIEADPDYETMFQKYRKNDPVDPSSADITIGTEGYRPTGLPEYQGNDPVINNTNGYVNNDEDLGLIFLIVLALGIWFIYNLYKSHKEYEAGQTHGTEETYGDDGYPEETYESDEDKKN